MKNILAETEKAFPPPWIPVTAFSNHDRIRRISNLRGDQELYKTSLLYQATVRAVPCFYYGEEIGLPQAVIPHKNSLDAVSFPFRKLPPFIFRMINRIFNSALHRDECRTPMPWNSGPNGGFCPEEVTPWLPLQKDYNRINVQDQAADPGSLLNWFRDLLKFRNTRDEIKFGDIELLECCCDGSPLPPGILAYRRSLDGGEQLDIFLNLTKKDRNIPVQPKKTEILFSTGNTYKVDGRIFLPGSTGIVIKIVKTSIKNLRTHDVFRF